MHRIAKMKDKLIHEAMNRMESMDGGSIEQMGQIIDMIKDLSEAERACVESDYYETITDAMDEPYGYMPPRYYQGEGEANRNMAGRMGYRDSKGRYASRPRRMRRSGYSDQSVENLRQMLDEADPEQKKQLKRDLQELMDEM